MRTGARASKRMSENIRYTDEPLGKLKIVPDFLPRPEDLVFRDEGVKVTIDAYAERHSRRRPAPSARTRAKARRAG
jgi:hypothetical protein